MDTSAYSAFMRGHGGVVDAVRHAEEIVFTPTVLGELKSGFLLGSQTARNEKELAQFLESSRVRTVVMDEETAARYAVIFADLKKAGRPVPSNDLWIAASAMQHGLPILSLDSHFLRIKQVLVEHFET